MQIRKVIGDIVIGNYFADGYISLIQDNNPINIANDNLSDFIQALQAIQQIPTPVMQEGKEYGDGGYEHPAPKLLPVDDEQPEHRGMPLFPTPYSDTDIHPRSAPPNEPGAPDSVTQLNV